MGWGSWWGWRPSGNIKIWRIHRSTIGWRRVCGTHLSLIKACQSNVNAVLRIWFRYPSYLMGRQYAHNGASLSNMEYFVMIDYTFISYMDELYKRMLNAWQGGNIKYIRPNQYL